MQITTSFFAAAAAFISIVDARAVCKAKSPVVLPTTDVSPALPAVNSSLVLKYIALGHGYQNYTCSGAGATAVATGALAVLYDALPLYPGQTSSSLSSTDEFYSLTALTVNTTTPLNLASAATLSSQSTTSSSSISAAAVDVANPFPAHPSALSLPGKPSMTPFGRHFFSDTGVPNFLVSDSAHLIASKKNAQNAPSDAPTGPHGEAAVAWLYLSDAGGSTGISAVYRVETAGGAAHVCDSAGYDSSAYAAFYYFYGSA